MFGLSFLAPAFLIGLAAAAAPFLLHLFARDSAPVTTLPTARFVPQAPVLQTRRRRPQDILLLLVRTAALVLLALMFARPYLARPTVAGEATLGIVALDTSFSMQGAERQARAQQLAREAIESMPGGAQVALIAFDSAPRVVVAPTSSRGEVLAAAIQVKPGFGSTNYASVLRQAIELTRRQSSRLVLITDGQRGGVTAEVLPLVPSGVEVVVRSVVAPPGNVSVDALEQVDGRFVAAVRNHGLAPVQTRLRWSFDGRDVGGQVIAIPPGERVEARLEQATSARTAVTASIDDAEGYEADNTRFAITDRPPVLPVLIVTGADAPAASTLYMQAALASGSERTPMRVSLVRSNDAMLTQAVTDARVIVVAGTRGLSRAGREAVRQRLVDGGGVLAVAGPDVEAGVVREWFDRDGPDWLASDDRGVTDTERGLLAADVRHPVLAALGATAGNLGQVKVERVWTLRESVGLVPLLRLAGGQAALVEAAVGRGRLFVLATDAGRRWNSWPLHPTFAPFWLESVRYLAGERTHEREALVGVAATFASDRPGIRERVPGGDRVAVNVDPRESALETLTPDEFLEGIERLDVRTPPDALAREQERGQNVWRTVLWFLLGVLAVEGVMAARARPETERSGNGSLKEVEGPA